MKFYYHLGLATLLIVIGGCLLDNVRRARAMAERVEAVSKETPALSIEVHYISGFNDGLELGLQMARGTVSNQAQALQIIGDLTSNYLHRTKL